MGYNRRLGLCWSKRLDQIKYDLNKKCEYRKMQNNAFVAYLIYRKTELLYA